MTQRGDKLSPAWVFFFFCWFSRGQKQSLPWPRRVTASGPPASTQVLPLGSHPGQHTQLLDEPCKRPLKHQVPAGACDTGALQGPGKNSGHQAHPKASCEHWCRLNLQVQRAESFLLCAGIYCKAGAAQALHRPQAPRPSWLDWKRESDNKTNHSPC